ncbi:MAG: SDR family oxidoreductase [Deltaproteobacteria bacterium]|nr:SDR family oxidoreductase [Deltaproteobacteria bacterium]
MEIPGSVVVVTGAAHGVGLAVTRLLAERGASVLAADADGDALAAAASGLDPERFATHVCDLAGAEACAALVAAAPARFGKLDAVVHAAGVRAARGSALLDLDDASYDASVGAGLRGAFFVNRAALKALTTQRRGELVNVAAVSGRKGRAQDSLGSAAQAGVIGMTEALVEEVRAFGVRVQCVIAPVALELAGAEPAVGPPVPDERVAEAVLFCLGLPPDACCENLVVQPFSGGRSRARKAAPKAPPHAAG